MDGTPEKTTWLPQAKKTSTIDAIAEVCDELRRFLIAKNLTYGDSAANPIRIFSRVSRDEQLAVRIDDELSRIARGNGTRDEDTELDLLGYLLLRRALRKC